MEKHGNEQILNIYFSSITDEHSWRIITEKDAYLAMNCRY